MGLFSGLGDVFTGIAGAVNPVMLGANLLGGGLDYLGAEADRRFEGEQNAEQNRIQWAIAQENLKQQREFAQQGIRWRVADAEAAGLHPLAALGERGSSFSPVSVYPGNTSSRSGAGNSYRALSNMGQNLTRAVMATATAEERLAKQAELEKTWAETDYVMQLKTESEVRTAEIGKNPTIPNIYGNNGVTGDVIDMRTPNKHIWVRTPDGYRLMWSPEFDAGMQNRPVSRAIEDLKDILTLRKGKKPFGKKFGGITFPR